MTEAEVPDRPFSAVHISPARGLSLNLGELIAYRGLAYVLTWRDLKVRYKQTVLGVAWALLQPLATLLVFTLIFDRVAKIPTGGIPYPAFAFVGLLPWQLFAHALTDSSNSLITNERLITKTYFPRAIIPTASVLSGLVDFSLSFLLLLPMLAWYGIRPTTALLGLPAPLLMALLAALGVGFWLSALNVQYRDVRYTIGFVVQIWLFATPIAYPSSVVPERWRLVYSLNPMVGVVQAFRWSLVGATIEKSMLLVSILGTLVLFFSGWAYFQLVERNFADVI